MGVLHEFQPVRKELNDFAIGELAGMLSHDLGGHRELEVEPKSLSQRHGLLDGFAASSGLLLAALGLLLVVRDEDSPNAESCSLAVQHHQLFENNPRNKSVGAIYDYCTG